MTRWDSPPQLSTRDRAFLRRCVELAAEALADGDEPFGSILVSAEGAVLFEDRNRVKDGDNTRHPEFEIAKWAAANLPSAHRSTAVVYTSGEHCPMCSAAHAWVGLGKIVYAASTAQLLTWLDEWQCPKGPVAPLPINAVAPDIPVAGPAPELTGIIRSLHAKFRRIPDGE
ncbi:nucleoside deaminase [Hoyosella sp. YIM 151337]|uniref:nucleoside deaminase n=1 Tax=Hoyosella sp. YIM 151337 TaxID=2992742 RepID=UPI002235DB16|nr:nucleoside deaminase [Hoyosella sp. YIM 151337]MCW4351744.1 nucleoside deaminase [Hoyosella sp. YIM 151337]